MKVFRRVQYINIDKPTGCQAYVSMTEIRKFKASRTPYTLTKIKVISLFEP